MRGGPFKNQYLYVFILVMIFTHFAHKMIYANNEYIENDFFYVYNLSSFPFMQADYCTPSWGLYDKLYNESFSKYSYTNNNLSADLRFYSLNCKNYFNYHWYKREALLDDLEKKQLLYWNHLSYQMATPDYMNGVSATIPAYYEIYYPQFYSRDDSNRNTSQTNNKQTDFLPHSMKGYELYSWLMDEKWFFSLLLGTNRLKFSEEILLAGNDIDAIKLKITQIPEGEHIFWIDEIWLKQVQGAIGDFLLPDKTIIDEIKNLCEELDLNLNISDHTSNFPSQYPYFEGITVILK